MNSPPGSHPWVSPSVTITVLGLLLLASGPRAYAGDSQPTFLASEGPQAFRIGAVEGCDTPLLPRGDGPFFRAMDRAPDGFLYGLSDDELYRLELATGAVESVGPIVFGAGERFWFTTGDDTEVPFAFAAPGATGPMIWYMRITVGLVDINDVETEITAEYSGILADGAPPATLVNDCLGAGCPDGLDEPIFQLVLFIEDDGIAVLSVAEFFGSDATTASGVFVVLTPNAVDASPLTLPGAGVTAGPDGTVLLLSDAEWDPFGEAALYELDLGDSEVQAQYLTTPDVPELNAIEILDNGQLYGAGEQVYLIDPLMGAAVPVGALAGNIAVELTAIQDEVYVLARDADDRSAVQEVPSGAVGLDLGARTYWGLDTLDDDPADLDGNGTVDAADMALFDEAFTGALNGPFVPPGVPPLLPDAIVAPALDSSGYPANCLRGFDADACAGAIYEMDVFDPATPGNLVEGTVVAPEDSSARLALGHWNGTLFIEVQVHDDARVSDDPDLGDQVEMYFDPNNSGLPMREGNSNGFRALIALDGVTGGDAAAFPYWSGGTAGYYRPGYRAKLVTSSIAGLGLELEAGATIGFDIAIRDVDPEDLDPARTFFFAQDADGESDEGQWGDLRLALGPLADPITGPVPSSGAALVDVDVTVGWTPSTPGLAYYVYLGAQPDALVFQGTTSAAAFALGTLSQASTYFWRVDAMNANGIRRGSTWQFTTESNPADADADGDVDEHDERRLFQRPLGDIDGDQIVDAADYAIILAALGSMVGDPAYDPSGDYDSDGAVTEADLAAWHCYFVAEGSAVEGDLDGDGDVDRDDLAIFTGCMTGPVLEAQPACWLADLTGDVRVDLLDSAHFLPLVEGVMP